jgi:hypothetical protein
MNTWFVREAISALLNLFDRRGFSFEGGADELRNAQALRLDNPKGLFGAAWRVANSAGFLADRESDRLRLALLSTAHVGYDHCVATQPRFRESYDRVRAALPTSGALSETEILDVFAEALTSTPSTGDPQADAAQEEVVDNGVAEPDGVTPSPPARRPLFTAPPLRTLRERYEELLRHFPAGEGDDNDAYKAAVAAFRDALTLIVKVGDEGRTFTEFAVLDSDLSELEPHILKLEQTDNPNTLQERSRQSRALAEAIDFGVATADDYRCSRAGWLLSAFWNSQLARYWPASRPNAAYDFLGYLSTLQAELRYSDAQFLLLLRVSFSICRIATHDGLMPYQFLSTFADRLPRWIQHAVGTVLATAGPGRVVPSRVGFDRRLVDLDRADYARTLLRLWRSDSDRAAAATMLLELGAWDAVRASRLIAQIFAPEETERELWDDLVTTMATRSSRVRVFRPNPWRPGTAKAITVERQAVATLAADVVERHYQVLEGDISLKGSDFSERRVPTYVCSVEFGPLGLFKLDGADRILREVEHFARFGQRLHPRYRASRCDQSKAVITEPDDAMQFVQGALTSYVFTEDETPRTFNTWFQKVSPQMSAALCAELFESALRPWYGHAASTTIDVFAEFPMFDEAAINRLINDCRKFHSIVLSGEGADEYKGRAVHWISSLLSYLAGEENSDASISKVGSELQTLRSYRSVCHGDLHLDNVLVVGRTGAEYPCVIDFEATQDGYILKDFGRFVAASFCRTFDWTAEERVFLMNGMAEMLLDWTIQETSTPPTEHTQALLGIVLAARRGILRAWQAGSYPTRIELAAALVGSFLPFARYPDTRRTNAELCLDLSSNSSTRFNSKPELLLLRAQ